MGRNIEKRKKRDEKVRQLFNKIATKNPKWRLDAVFEEVANQVFLEPKTVEDIVKGYGIYAY